jgi:hypothetical protein
MAHLAVNQRITFMKPRTYFGVGGCEKLCSRRKKIFNSENKRACGAYIHKQSVFHIPKRLMYIFKMQNYVFLGTKTSNGTNAVHTYTNNNLYFIYIP